MQTSAQILVVDDNEDMVRLLAEQLSDAGYGVETATSGVQAVAAIRKQVFDAVVSDLRMGKVDGFDVLEAVREVDPAIPVLIMTAFGGVEGAVEAMKKGAYHYFTKPFRIEEMRLALQRALADRRLRDEVRLLRQTSGVFHGFGSLIGRSAPMQALYEKLQRLSSSSAPVLLRGESGSGKELVARALHFEGTRRGGPFTAINCSALPSTLLESELFGHVRGAFTGAHAHHRGLFVEADGGTLFLDEIGDMPLELQAKLLRVLEGGEVRPVGAATARKVDVRVVAATHQPLEERVAQRQFREDLFYRLNVLPVQVPPLRERPEDIPLLVEHFLARSRHRNAAAQVQRFSVEAMRALASLPWPGNVRELENLIERVVLLGDKELADFELLRQHAPGLEAATHPLEVAKREMTTLRQLESDYIAWVIARCGGNKTRAAEILGIDVSTIHRRGQDRADVVPQSS